MSRPKVGDVVQLKSGGPSMTVAGSSEGNLVCAWFDSREIPQVLHTAMLSADSLRVIPSE